MKPVLETSPLAALRKLLAAAFLLGVLGAGVELVLLNHTESWKQWLPLVLMGASLPVLALVVLRPCPGGLLVFRGLMLLYIAAGVLGVWFHHQGSLEFQRETSPSLAGFELFLKAIRSKAPPALAPGTMIELGLVGLAFAFRHPALKRRPGELKSTSEI